MKKKRDSQCSNLKLLLSEDWETFLVNDSHGSDCLCWSQILRIKLMNIPKGVFVKKEQRETKKLISISSLINLPNFFVVWPFLWVFFLIIKTIIPWQLMHTHKHKGKAPLLLYSLFLVIVVLATFNYFLSSELQPQQKFTAHFENNDDSIRQEKVVFSAEEESKLTRSCLLLWGASHQGDNFHFFFAIIWLWMKIVSLIIFQIQTIQVISTKNQTLVQRRSLKTFTINSLCKEQSVYSFDRFFVVCVSSVCWVSETS